jgi:hypothetical protein
MPVTELSSLLYFVALGHKKEHKLQNPAPILGVDLLVYVPLKSLFSYLAAVPYQQSEDDSSYFHGRHVVRIKQIKSTKQL